MHHLTEPFRDKKNKFVVAVEKKLLQCRRSLNLQYVF